MIGLLGRDMDKNSLEWLFGAVTRLHHNYMHSFMRAQGLTEITHPRLLFLIEALENKGQGPAQNELAAMLSVSPASIAVSLKRMEKSGLITRVADENDSRRNIIRTTEKSRELLAQGQHMMKELLAHPFDGFSAAERAQLADFFQRIIANLESMGASVLESCFDKDEDKF